jgi:hypothetical protein
MIMFHRSFFVWLVVFFLGYSGNFVATRAKTFKGNINEQGGFKLLCDGLELA